eukprot:jgi/Chlat1/5925/Chrsp4S06255
MAENGGVPGESRASGSGSSNRGKSSNHSRPTLLSAAYAIGGIFIARNILDRCWPGSHVRTLAKAMCGEKLTSEQALRDPAHYFNVRASACEAAHMANGARLLYVEQANVGTPERPFRQRFLVVRPSKRKESDVEVASHAVSDPAAYSNYCDRPVNARPSSAEAASDIGEHLTTVYLSRCKPGQGCLYQGSTPPEGYPSSWGGAVRCTSDVTVYKHAYNSWDRGYDARGQQVWGPREGPLEFRPKAR